jgi:hypothetical protein
METASAALADALEAEGFVAKAGLDARDTGAIHVMIGPRGKEFMRLRGPARHSVRSRRSTTSLKRCSPCSVRC